MHEPYRNRRAEDLRLEQLLELSKAQTDVLTDAVRRLAVVEREMVRTRQLWEALRVDDMSTEQKRALLPMTGRWLDAKEDDVTATEKLRRAAALSTVIQGATALMILTLTLYTFFHH